jgi:proteasome lid subunit RPN8/RPN11
MSLTISQADLDALRAQAERDYPHETCGLLGGTLEGATKRVTRLVPLANARHDSPENRYLIEPDVFRRAADALERGGLEVLGVYHSHPDHPARPSAFDRDHAWPRLSYVIVRVDRGGAADTNSWVLADDRASFDQEPIIIEERMASWQSQY